MSASAAQPLIAVFDTNVVIAGLLWDGPPYSLLLRAAERQDLVLATSPTLIVVLGDTLSLPKFRKRNADAATTVEELVAAYRGLTVMVTPLLSMKQPLKLNYLWAALCICGAVYFVFRES